MCLSRYILWLAGCAVGSVGLLAQPAVRSSPPIQIPSIPPMPPRPRSPIEYFRQLLAASPAERAQALAEKTETQRKYLMDKLREYAALTPEDRELRLRLMELRWYLLPLMKTGSTHRQSQLEMIPDEDRKLVEQRLQQWDQVPPDLQKEFMENEMTVDYFLRLESSSPAQREVMLQTLSAEERNRLEGKLEKWRALPVASRQRMCDNFHQFFELTPREKERTLGVLPEAERRQMEQTLQAFEKLPSAQRRLCIESFRKFANMTPVERTLFLKNAERWQAMAQGERRAWRDLVTTLPPLPPGFGEPPMPPPPTAPALTSGPAPAQTSRSR